MEYTTYQEVVEVFESTFQHKAVIAPNLVQKWFNMALSEFSVEIESLVFDTDNNRFVFFDKDKNPCKLPDLYCQILGYTIKRYYLEREYDKVNKRTNIIGKDLTLNNTDADKKNMKSELDYVKEIICDFYEKLKPTAYV